MRRFLYLSLIERLKRLTDRDGRPVIRTFDLWNEQISFLEQEDPFDVPAVFIEFRPVKWAGGGTQGSAREGSGFQRQTLERFDLLDRMDRHLFNLSGDDGSTSFSLFRRTGSSTNHNHEELVEDVTDFTCKVMDRG